jgi:hypothetical protein
MTRKFESGELRVRRGRLSHSLKLRVTKQLSTHSCHNTKQSSWCAESGKQGWNLPGESLHLILLWHQITSDKIRSSFYHSDTDMVAVRV